MTTVCVLIPCEHNLSYRCFGTNVLNVNILSTKSTYYVFSTFKVTFYSYVLKLLSKLPFKFGCSSLCTHSPKKRQENLWSLEPFDIFYKFMSLFRYKPVYTRYYF